MKVRYRIGDLELRLNDIPKEPCKIHSPWSEIVQWSKREDVTEHCWTIATFEYDKDGYPELHYCGSRPLELDEHEAELFRILIKEGYGYKRNKDGQIIKIDFTEEYD